MQYGPVILKINLNEIFSELHFFGANKSYTCVHHSVQLSTEYNNDKVEKYIAKVPLLKEGFYRKQKRKQCIHDGSVYSFIGVSGTSCTGCHGRSPPTAMCSFRECSRYSNLAGLSPAAGTISGNVASTTTFGFRMWTEASSLSGVTLARTLPGDVVLKQK